MESAEQVEILRELQCDEIQGYYYSRPLVPEEFITYVSRLQHAPS